MTKKQIEKIMDKEIIEHQKEIQKINQLLSGLEFSVIDVELFDNDYASFDRCNSGVRVKFRDNKEGQTSEYLEKHNACGYEKCEHYSDKLGEDVQSEDVQGIHQYAHYNSGSVEMEVEESYTYDHFNPLTFTDGKFYFMLI